MRRFLKKNKDILPALHTIVVLSIGIAGIIASQLGTPSQDVLSTVKNQTLSFREYLPALAGATPSSGTTLLLLPEQSRFLVEEQPFSFYVHISTRAVINTIQVTLTYPTDTLKLIGFSDSDSIVEQWVQGPLLDPENGAINFSGIIEGKGFRGEGELLKLTFKAQKTGRAELTFLDSLALAADGAGTNTLTQKETLTYYIRKKSLPTPDINDDGAIDGVDVKLLTAHWGESGSSRYDLNNDGIVNIIDFNLLSSMYEQ